MSCWQYFSHLTGNNCNYTEFKFPVMPCNCTCNKTFFNEDRRRKKYDSRVTRCKRVFLV